jgi:hypothetical protein
MRSPIDEVSSFVISELSLNRDPNGSDIISMPTHSEIISIIKAFVEWANQNGKVVEESKIDISTLNLL